MSNPSQPTNKSGGFDIGDLSSQRDTNVAITDSAGRDKHTITNSPGASINYITVDGRHALFVGVPAMPNPFVGREVLLEELVQQLTSGRSLALSAEGLAGVGKTTLAVALAYHHGILTHFSDGILWASLGTAPDVLSTLGRWAEALGGDVTHLPAAAQRQQAVRDLIGQKRLLLIIDDAWQLEAAQPLRCGGPYCVHLLTTRDKGIARGFAGNQQLTAVPPLDDDPASQLLQMLAPLAWETDPAAARQLAQAVGGLPLALELLGGYLADPNAPERHYFPAARQAALADLTVAGQRLQLATQRLGSQDGPISLQATIELSLADLTEATRTAFYSLGAFAPKPATFSQEAALAVTQASERDLALLMERNLLAWDGDRCTLHQTLADVAVSHLPPEVRTRHWDYYLAQANADWEAWQQIQTFYEQLQWAWHNAPDAPDTLKLLNTVGIYRRRRGLWADYLAGAERGLVICQAHGLRQNESVLLVHLGLAYDTLGQRQIALEYYQRALPIMEKVGDRAGQAQTLNNIGAVYNALGQQQTALEYYQRTLPIQEEVGDRAGQAQTLNNIGAVYNALGQRQTALDYYQRALPIREEVGDRAGQATTLNNIGLVYNDLGQRQTALEYYQRALPIMEKVGHRAGQAATLNNIGLVYIALGQRQTALEYYQRTLPIQEEVGNRAGQATTLHNIGAVYNALGQRQTALDYYQRALPIREEVGDRAGQATTLNNIGAVYYALGQRQTALDYYQRALPIMEKVGDRAGQAATLTNIGVVYNALGQWQTALDYYQHALPIHEAVGNRYVEAITRYNMAMIYRDHGDLAGAIAQLRQVVALDRLVQHPDLEANSALLAKLEAELAHREKQGAGFLSRLWHSRKKR